MIKDKDIRRQMASKTTVADQKYEYLTPEVGRRAQLEAVGRGRGAGAL